MAKMLIVSDCGVQTGFGRWMDEVATRLYQRGHDITAASFAYDGLLPPMMNKERLPYWVATLQGKPDWVGEVVKLWGAIRPDIVIVCQDFPYAQQLRAAPGIDWSVTGFIIMTPIDGTPIYGQWLDVMRQADAGLTMSSFGVEGFRQAGVRVGLCRPGTNVNEFYQLPIEQRLENRAKLGLGQEYFIVGSMAQNQGRKDIPGMLKGFDEFAKDKPHARLFMDMEAQGPVGYDIPALCQQQGYDASKLLFRQAAVAAGLHNLNERYNLLDAHMVIAHREGYGLPLQEAMACGVVSIAQNYCSGPEIVGGGKGVLVKTIGYPHAGTWGGSEDHFVDVADLTKKLNWLHNNPMARVAMAERGMKWARAQTWDNAADQVNKAVEWTARKYQAMAAALQAQMNRPAPVLPVTAPVQPSPDGVKLETVQTVELLEG